MDPLGPPPEINVLLLGDAEVGKSTFLSRLSLGVRPRDDSLPPYSLPKLRDLDQPFSFNVTLYRRPYALNFYDTASPTNYTLLQPNFIILCYDVSRRSTFTSLKTKWRDIVNGHFNYNEELPVMVLGLKRDARREWTEEEKASGEGGKGGKGESVMPQEGVNLAQELRADRYAECSAVTGELCREVLEDVAKTCAKTLTDSGGKTEGGCVIM